MRKKAFNCLLLLLPLAIFADPPPPPEGFKWEVDPRFTDEFEGNKLDGEKWHDHHPRWKGRPPAKFIPENVFVQDGMLHLKNGMLDEPVADRNDTFTIGGAAVVSKKIEAHYGYYECRLKASGISMSSTFWMSNGGHEYKGIGNVSQELDILETVGGAKKNPAYANYMNSNTHVWHNRSSLKAGNKAKLPGKADEDFNIYGCWWENANTCHFYLNNQHVGTVNFDTSLIPHPFEHPMHINMVTETYDWEIPPTPEEVNNPEINTTRIDWVRVYTLEPADGTFSEWKLKKIFNEFREWNAANGKSSTKAKLVHSKHGYVTLEKEDGNTVKIPVKLLCEEDQKLLEVVEKSL